jgi:hypothetical protein
MAERHLEVLAAQDLLGQPKADDILRSWALIG